MARGHHNCWYGQDGLAYGPRIEAVYAHDENPERDQAFKALGTALEALSDPVSACVKALKPTDVKDALEAGDANNRNRVLRPLGLNLTPRNIGLAMSSDVTNRLRRAEQHDRRHAADRLGIPVYSRMLVAAMAPEDSALAAADKLSVKSDQVKRLALWSCTAPSAAGARVLVWAGEQSWFGLDGASTDDLDTVLAAARNVVDATAGYNMFAAVRHGEEDIDVEALYSHERQDDEAEQAPTASPTATLPAEKDSAISDSSAEPDQSATREDTDPTDTDAAPEVSPVEQPTASTEEPAIAAQVLSADDLSALLVTLDATLTAAAAQARAIAETLEEGNPPAAEALTVLDTALREFEAAEEHLRAAGATPAVRSTSGLRQALDAVTRQQGEAEVRAGLEAFASLRATENEGLEDALAAAVSRTETLLSAMLWSPADRAEAEALATIAELATGTGEPTALIAAQGRIVSAAPHLALLAVKARSLTSLTPTEPQPATPGEATESQPEEPAAAEPSPTPDGAGDSAPQTPEPEAADQPAAAADQPAQAEAEGVAANRSVTEPAQDVPSPTTSSMDSITEPAAASTDSDRTAAADGDETTEPDLVYAVATLVTQGRHALAAQVAARCSTPPVNPDLLRTSALAAAVRNPHGQVASALHQRVGTLDSQSLSQDTTALLLAAPALLRTALVTGEPAAGAVLLALQPHLGDGLETLAHEVGRRAVTGVLVESPPLTALADVTETERVLTDAQESARELLRPRRMRFKRASDIVNGWLSPDGMIGEALHAVVDDDRDKLDVVTATVALLSDPTEVTKSIEAEDRKLRTTSSKALQGSVRTDLVTEATKAVPALSQWADAVASLALADRSARWSTTEVADMRSAVLTAGAAALASVEGRRQDADPLVAAVATSAHASLTQTLALLDGTEQVSSAEIPPAAVLGTDALRVRDAHVDVVTGEVTLSNDTPAQELVDAIDRTWDQAVKMHVGAENFTAAHHLLRTSQAGMLDGDAISPETVALVSSHETSSRTELDWLRSGLAAELRDARRNNQINEEQDADLTAMLRDTERSGTDLAAVRTMLNQISKRLPDYRARAEQTLRARLEQVKGTNSMVTGGDVERVSGFITSGDLGTAEELIYLLETNEQLPSPRNHEDLKRFFPIVPDALPDGITGSIVAIARDGSTVAACPTLDFSSLSPDQAALTADALAGWRDLSGAPPEKRYNISITELLLPALRVCGIEAKKATQLPDAPRGRDRRFVDVVDVTISGKAMVPAFGSNAGDRRRVLLAWGRPSADTLMSWVDQDPASGPVIVAYFGTMNAQVRHDLASLAPRSHAPVIVLDDAALVYLAACGDRLLEPTMRILLPFAHVNPYVHEKRGLVAPEMFYGRKKEQRQVIDPNGTQIIYGGRGLGKSALLRDAESEFERSAPSPGSRVAVYLSLDDLQIGSGRSRSAEAVWDGLLDSLTRRGVIPTKGIRSGSAHSRVVAGINAWLEADTTRRLLVLLDESDRFFEADAPNFGETSRLRNLGTTTRDRAKVVFAGLHSVQRFTKVAGNGPFSHLAQRPTVIGPLKPQWALNLLTEPMAAMGYVFEEPDLVNRVLAKCSYQPFLLQMFGHRLVEHMHARRRQLGAQIPYVVTRADIEAVDTNEELREDISTAFRDTLNLDPRYNVIANVMARNAHQSGLEARLTDTELREECLQWWEDGFNTLDTAAFRSYLNEMVGLGVLARNSDGRGWRLRGPAVLNMVGMPSDVENQLLGADTESLRDDFVALASRSELPDGRYSPLTAGQVDDLLGDHSIQVRVVLGSDATGIADTTTAVKDAAKNRFTVPPVGKRNAFETALTAGDPGQRRVIISDLRDFTSEVCTATLRAAVDLTPDRPGVTRSVVLVAGAHQMPFWREVMQAEASTPSLGTVALSRHDAKTLRVWTMTAQRFSGGDRIDQLLAVTGGWPFLLEQVAAKVTQASKEPGALAAMEEHLATEAGAAKLVDAVGLRLDAMVERAYGDLVTLLGDDSTDLAGLHVAAESTTDPEEVIACLDALGVFSRPGKGEYRLEPVLAHAWLKSGSTIRSLK